MLKIEKANRKDARAALEIRNAAILNQCVSHYSMDVLKEWTSGELSDEFTDSVEMNFYVAIDDNQVVGTGMINIESGKIDAIFVHLRGDRFILEAFPFHHMAPVAGAVSNRKKDWLVQPPGFFERVFAPGKPIDRIMLMLQQVRRRFRRQTIRVNTAGHWFSSIESFIGVSAMPANYDGKSCAMQAIE